MNGFDFPHIVSSFFFLSKKIVSYTTYLTNVKETSKRQQSSSAIPSYIIDTYLMWKAQEQDTKY